MYQQFRNVGLKVDIAAQGRQVAQAGAFVCNLERLTDPQRERRVHVEENVVQWSL